jgi:hypothetical protein
MAPVASEAMIGISRSMVVMSSEVMDGWILVEVEVGRSLELEWSMSSGGAPLELIWGADRHVPGLTLG